MSDNDSPPTADADRLVTDALDLPDPEAPADAPAASHARSDDEREVPAYEDFQQENAATSLDQPSEDSP